MTTSVSASGRPLIVEPEQLLQEFARCVRDLDSDGILQLCDPDTLKLGRVMFSDVAPESIPEYANEKNLIDAIKEMRIISPEIMKVAHAIPDEGGNRTSAALRWDIERSMSTERRLAFRPHDIQVVSMNTELAPYPIFAIGYRCWGEEYIFCLNAIRCSSELRITYFLPFLGKSGIGAMMYNERIDRLKGITRRTPYLGW